MTGPSLLDELPIILVLQNILAQLLYWSDYHIGQRLYAVTSLVQKLEQVVRAALLCVACDMLPSSVLPALCCLRYAALLCVACSVLPPLCCLRYASWQEALWVPCSFGKPRMSTLLESVFGFCREEGRKVTDSFRVTKNGTGLGTRLHCYFVHCTCCNVYFIAANIDP